jgi:bifunctional NMN adenylyltransferase/nudix hydrolase
MNARSAGRCAPALADDKKEACIPDGTFWFLREWIDSPEFQRLASEYFFMEEYLAQFPQTPYPRYFTAADACVIQSGHVLLVRRGQMPGEGLWALPGGHVGMHETFREAAIRELIEETGIDIPGPDAAAAIRGEKFSTIRGARRGCGRSRRLRHLSRRHITPRCPRPDDANCARWWPIDEVTREMMFEDHFNVIEHFANQFRDL